jgi:hypothetical protein
MTIDELLAKLTALHEAATVAEQEYDAYAQFNFSNAAYNHYPALVAEIRRLREELTKHGRKEAEAQLATAKRDGAAEELRRLADEWAASCEAEFFADWLKDRAAELEGK